jgi:CubicO group peptidase (beta-lactamase class C family)
MTSLPNEALQLVCESFSRSPFVSSLTIRIESLSGDKFFFSQSGQDTQAFIASSTKTFISELFLQLDAQGKISLDSQLSKYLSEAELQGLNTYGGQENAKKLTVRQLLRNTSGIPDYYGSKALKPGKDIAERTARDPGWNYQETLAIARSKKAKFAPGDGVEYSFTNFQILSELAERVLMQPLAKTLDDRIFGKLELQDTYLFGKEHSSHFGSIAPLLYGKQKYLGVNRMASFRGEGGIVSTTANTMAFIKYFVAERLSGQFDHQLLGDSRKLYPGVSYGQGVMQIDIPRGLGGFRKLPTAVGHLGATGHFMVFVPALDSFLVGTVNQLANPILSVRFLAQLMTVLLKYSKE